MGADKRCSPSSANCPSPSSSGCTSQGGCQDSACTRSTCDTAPCFVLVTAADFESKTRVTCQTGPLPEGLHQMHRPPSDPAHSHALLHHCCADCMHCSSSSRTTMSYSVQTLYSYDVTMMACIAAFRSLSTQQGYLTAHTGQWGRRYKAQATE